MADGLNADDSFELRSAVQLLIAQMKDAANNTDGYSRATAKAIAEAEQEREARKKATKSLDESRKALDKFADKAKDLGKELVRMGRAGTEFAQKIGTSAVKGVELDLKNRTALLSQIGKVELNRMVNMQQIQAAEQSLTDTFISTRAGFELSAEGAAKFAQNLKGGFGSEFELTGDSLKALTVIGATTEEQMNAFRQATGRASLSSAQLSTIVNKNSMSFLLFGNKFAKAAADAERAGISLAAIQGAQESLVSSLDNVIDTVSQLNQLGAQVDFGTLVQKLEQEGPDAVLQYLSSTVPGDLFQSTSFRALFNQLGINSEQILRQQQVGSAAENIESQMTKAATSSTATAKAMTAVARGADIVEGSFGMLAKAAYGAATSLLALSVTGLPKGWASQLLGLRGGATAFGGMGMLGATGSVLGGAALGIGGAMAGNKLAEQGNVKTGTALGALGGGLGLALALAPFTGGLSLAALGVGALAGGAYAYSGKKDDMYSDYGNRTLLTTSGAYALNNRDTVIAGTNLFKADDLMSFGEGALSVLSPGVGLAKAMGAGMNKSGGGNDDLRADIKALINAIQSANTTITVDGSSQSMNRFKMVGVNVVRNAR
jgi:hypothetical protein